MKLASLVLSLLAVVTIVEFAAAQVNVHFTNSSPQPANVEWVNESGKTYYMTVPAGETRSLQTYVGHRWLFSNSTAIASQTVQRADQVITLGGYQPAPVLPYQPIPQQDFPISREPVHQPATSSVNQSVVAYAQSVVGQRIGNGQCTELAIAALRSAGAQPNQSYVWGTALRGAEDLQPGDIIQMFDARFEMPNGSSSWSTGPHTAIVTGVQGSVIQVLHQNIAGSPVQAGEYDLRYRTAGRLEFYRPVASNNAGRNGLGNFGGPINNTPLQPRTFPGNIWQQGLQPIRFNQQPSQPRMWFGFE